MDSLFQNTLNELYALEEELAKKGFPIVEQLVKGPEPEVIVDTLHREFKVIPTGDVVAWFNWFGGTKPDRFMFTPYDEALNLDEAIERTRSNKKYLECWVESYSDVFDTSPYKEPAIAIFRLDHSGYAPLTDTEIGLFVVEKEGIGPIFNNMKSFTSGVGNYKKPTLTEFVAVYAEAVRRGNILQTENVVYGNSDLHVGKYNGDVFPWGINENIPCLSNFS